MTLTLKETIDQFVMAVRVHWYVHVLRREGWSSLDKSIRVCSRVAEGGWSTLDRCVRVCSCVAEGGGGVIS